MKKSKIIIPALAMIGLSAVASVTGSVAWFTAQRTGRITTADFSVTKIDGNLNLTLTQGAGTTVNGNAVSIEANAKSKDVSFDPKNHQLYDSSDNATSFVKISNDTAYEQAKASHPYRMGSTDIYYAFTWKIDISMTDAAQAGAKMNVFFDYRAYNDTGVNAQQPIGSKMTKALQDENDTNNDSRETAKGFRIAIISPTKTIVYAGLEDNLSELKAITDVTVEQVTTATEVAYRTNPLNSGFSYFASGVNYAKAGDENVSTSYDIAKDADDWTEQQGRADYLGELVNTNDSTRTMAVWCVAWYEGTDGNVINEAKMQKVQASLGFYSTSKNA